MPVYTSDSSPIGSICVANLIGSGADELGNIVIDGDHLAKRFVKCLI